VAEPTFVDKRSRGEFGQRRSRSFGGRIPTGATVVSLHLEPENNA
jgi:hypothetical protein